MAYIVSSAPFRYDLVLNDGSSTTIIDLNAASGFVDLFQPSGPFINDSGAVAIRVPKASFGAVAIGSVLRINPDGSVTTLATRNSDGVSGDFIEFSLVAMNSAGEVALKVTESDLTFSIVRLDDSAQTIIDSATATRFNFTQKVAINDSGVVAYGAQGAEGNNIFVGDGTAPSQLALPLPLEGGPGAPDIDNSGNVVGTNSLSLLIGVGGTVNQVVVDSATSPFSPGRGPSVPALNSVGSVLFSASTSSAPGSSGLYFGDDPVNDKLIDVGDSLFGEIVGNPTGIPFCCGAAVRFGGGMAASMTVDKLYLWQRQCPTQMYRPATLSELI